MSAEIILASNSPRRKQLLEQINIRFQVYSVDVDETPLDHELPEAYSIRIAAEKSAACVALLNPTLPVLAADTVVAIENTIFGKPKNKADGLAMLRELSGKTHSVYTAVSVRGKIHTQAISVTEVSFRNLQEREILAYWQSGEPLDKAGAYAIQGQASVFVKAIKGSFSGVVGLPLFETAQLLLEHNIDVFNYE